MFGDLLKAVVGTVVLPVKVLTDVAESMDSRDSRIAPRTSDSLEEILRNLNNATKSR